MIRIENITKKFDDFTALDNFSLEIRKGSAYGLLGTNGAGKSTLLRLMTGVYKADSGNITYEGAPIYDNVAVKQRVLLISDETAQFNHMTLKEMRRFYKTFYPKFSDETFERLHGILGLPMDKRLSTFSKGMKRQAAVICGIASSPDYLLLDEAFDGLDPTMRIAVKKMIIDAMCESDMTAILSSHNLNEIEEFCDTVGLLNDGKLVFNREMDILKGVVHKLQCSFDTPPTAAELPELDVLLVEQKNGLTNIIVRGDADKSLDIIRSKNPKFCDLIPLSLEEIFIYEMEALKYDHSKLQ